MKAFSRSKFESLTQEQQHRHCADLLRQTFTTLDTNTFSHYETLCSWLDLKPPQLDRKPIADRYHFHLNQAKRSLKEHNLLPQVTKSDRTTPISQPITAHLYLDQLRSAHNVGSIIRTVEAFGLGTIYASPQTPNTGCKQVKDASMQADQWVSFTSAETVDTLPGPLIALETVEDATPYTSYKFPETFTLAIGNEEYGCSDAILAKAETIISIPLAGRKNSLNVANAFAIVAAEIRRQYQKRERS